MPEPLRDILPRVLFKLGVPMTDAQKIQEFKRLWLAYTNSLRPDAFWGQPPETQTAVHRDVDAAYEALNRFVEGV